MGLISNDCLEQLLLVMLNARVIEKCTGSMNRKVTGSLVRKIEMLIKTFFIVVHRRSDMILRFSSVSFSLTLTFEKLFTVLLTFMSQFVVILVSAWFLSSRRLGYVFNITLTRMLVVSGQLTCCGSSC